MKKSLIALIFVLSIHFSYAQKSVYTESPGRLFSQGKEMFLDNNYTGCINTMQEFKKASKDTQLNAEADYMIVSSLFYQGKAETGNLLKDFLEKYPETYHRNQISFFIGSIHFSEKDWQRATFWFDQVDMDYLSATEQEDYSYRKAYSLLQSGKEDEARQLFGVLSRISNKYAEPASYYLAYIDFQKGNYDAAIPTFRKLKNKQEYRENATFFLMQSAYRQGNIDETISEGREYATQYPKSQNAAEVFRLLGSSYYQKGDLVQSVIHYERFLQYNVPSFPEDMYQLGDAYYQNKAYPQAVEVLKNAATTNDKLGQAAYMLLGQSYLKVNDNTNALMAFDAAARSNFDSKISEDALYNYVLLTNKGSVSAFDQSINAFQRFLTEYPNSKYNNEINSLFASTLLSSKNYNSALNAINNIKSPSRQILDAKQIITFQLGTQEFINNNYDAAIKDFDACINMGEYNKDARNEAYFWRGEAAYRQGNYQTAARDYSTYTSRVSASRPNYALAFYNLGYANFQMKNYNTALTNFKKYLSVEKNRQLPNYADALNRAGDCNLFNRSFSEAERYYAQAVNLNPGNADYSEFQKAFVLGLQRNYAGKVSALNDMMAKYPNSEYYDDALYEKSRALVMQNKEKEAITVLEKLQREYPQSNFNQQAGVQLGQLYFNTNNPQKSIEAYKHVISNYPNTEEARMSILSLEGVYKEINDISSYASYVNSLGTGISISATRQDSLTYLAAENVYMKGNKNQAKNSFVKYLQSYPKGGFAADANYYLGTMALEASDKKAALEYFKEVISFSNPKYMDDALLRASEIEYDNKDYESAYNTYQKLSQAASSSDNKNVGQLGMLRSAYLMQKDNEVVAAASKLLENTKTSPDIANEARFYRGKSLMNLSQTDNAMKDFAEVAKDSRTSFGAESQFILAETYYKWKSYDKAEKQVLAFMKQGTPHQYWLARAIIILSDVYNAKGDYFQSRQYLESLKANYGGGEADINQMISERLTALENK
jgi:TolA-binding protein